MTQKPRETIENCNLTCKKEGHYNYDIQFFKFSTNQDEILQCLLCSQEDHTNKKKIVLRQIFDAPPWQIRNFPPVDDDEKGKQIRNQLKEFPADQIVKRKQEIYENIENLYKQQKQKLLDLLETQRSQTISTFDQIYHNYEIFSLLDINQLKEKIQQFSQKEISMDCLFQFQQSMENEFKCPENIEKIFQSEQMSKKLETKFNDLGKQLKAQIEVFENNNKNKQKYEQKIKVLQLQNEKKEESIISLTKQISSLKVENQNLNQQIQMKTHDAEQKAQHINKLKIEIQQIQNSQQDEQKLLKSPFQFNNQLLKRNISEPTQFSDTFSVKSQQAAKPIPFKVQEHYLKQDKEFNNPTNQYDQKFLFSKSKFDTDILDEITITNSPFSFKNSISFDSTTIQKVKQVYSQFLSKKSTHHFKIKINLNGDNQQQLGFYLTDEDTKDDLYEHNRIIITNFTGQCYASNGASSIQRGDMFQKFMKDDQTVFNIVINYAKSSFEIYDDNHICYVKNKINSFVIDKNMILGIQFIQNSQKQGKIQFQGYSKY